ncbi:unnamed protein product [Bursaphelenchus xylophilus]|uniref:(pine wood nematode) hypothetical protein n=1 Tax=Bursaphelenchus xylophilus TaxID=6326 RepID=A0A7I8XKI4_BURXY|nr:unnamed protein product [Bursaphelenchus xylophilus]CAG9120713.1 unnamed protein product [Bursaphelenchus xylophilus]
MGNKPSLQEQCQQKQLKLHNEYRKKHGVDPLKLSKDLCKDAQLFAEKLASEGILRHDPTCKLGENVFFSSSSPDGATETWYKESNVIKSYGEIEDICDQISHFSQIVWKECHAMGIGVAKGSNGYYVVCRYMPNGNRIGHYKENVFEPKN